MNADWRVFAFFVPLNLWLAAVNHVVWRGSPVPNLCGAALFVGLALSRYR